jgi:hypothetical protein
VQKLLRPHDFLHATRSDGGPSPPGVDERLEFICDDRLGDEGRVECAGLVYVLSVTSAGIGAPRECKVQPV